MALEVSQKALGVSPQSVSMPRLFTNICSTIKQCGLLLSLLPGSPQWCLFVVPNVCVSVTAHTSSCVLADHSWSGLSGPDTDADATHSQGPPGQDLCNALGERLQVGNCSFWSDLSCSDIFVYMSRFGK